MEYKSASRRRIFNRTRFFENLQTARSSFHVTTRSISFPICSRLSLGTESVGPATSCRMNRIPPPADVEKLILNALPEYSNGFVNSVSSLAPA